MTTLQHTLIALGLVAVGIAAIHAMIRAEQRRFAAAQRRRREQAQQQPDRARREIEQDRVNLWLAGQLSQQTIKRVSAARRCC